MNERFTLDHTLIDIVENERVNKKLHFIFDLTLADTVKWPFRKMKLKHMVHLTQFPAKALVDAANLLVERRESGEKISIPIWRGLSAAEEAIMENVVLIPFVKDPALQTTVLICIPAESYLMHVEGLYEAIVDTQINANVYLLRSVADHELADMARAVRFMKANAGKLGINAEQIYLAAYQQEIGIAAQLMSENAEIVDETHRYDTIAPQPAAVFEVADAADIRELLYNPMDNVNKMKIESESESETESESEPEPESDMDTESAIETEIVKVQEEASACDL